ncbi:MAG: hypothetical protein P9M07_01500 [Candidatus Aceula meridiana]|nr:hypothetical protein [Candidatus Aceula meridiana]
MKLLDSYNRGKKRILLISLFVLGFCFFASKHFVRGEVVEGEVHRCEMFAMIGGSGRCWGEIAVQENDTSICDKARESEYCYIEFAARKKDPALCLEQWGKLAGSEPSYYRDMCLKEVAIRAQIPSLCDDIGPSYFKTECYTELAKLEGEKSYCEKISSDDHRYSCYVNMDPHEYGHLCEEIKNRGNKDGCIRMVAMEEKDYKKCLEIISGQGRDLCLGQVEDYDFKKCELIEDQRMKDHCYIEVIKFRNYDVEKSVCRKIENQYSHDECVSKLAYTKVAHKDCDQIENQKFRLFCNRKGMPKECDVLEDEGERKECFSLLTYLGGDASCCSQLPEGEERRTCHLYIYEKGYVRTCSNTRDETKKQQCYLQLAVDTGNVEVCNQMEKGAIKQQCYHQVAEKTGNIQACHQMEGEGPQWNCYAGVALHSKDKTICQKIEDDYWKGVCLKWINIDRDGGNPPSSRF